MKKLVLIYMSILALLVEILGDTIIDITPGTIEALEVEITNDLQNEIEKITHRRGVCIKLQSHRTPDSLRFMLDRRSQRETVFNIVLTAGNDEHWTVTGRLFSSNEEQVLRGILAKTFKKQKLIWLVETGILGLGSVCTACANLYVEPRRETGDNLAGQLLYGMPIVLLETNEDKQFFRVQSKLDGYVAWMEIENLQINPVNSWQQWLDAPKIYLPNRLSEYNLLVGTPLGKISGGMYWIYPQNRTVALTPPLFQETKPSPEQIINTAKRFLPTGDLGPVTYLWGGTSIPYLDCSGFVQMVFRLNGILLPRDSDQQLQYSHPISQEGLTPGDLIFFSKHRRHPTHVGIYLEKDMYIHCSSSGPGDGVKINSLRGETEYEKYLREIYYGAGRVLETP